MRRLVLKLALVVVIGLVPVVTVASQAAYAGDPASSFIAKINALRASKGLGALTPNGPLTSFAASWTNHMAQTGQLAHNPSLASAPGNWTVVGENVGVGSSVDELFTAFVNSPHHYENLVDPRFDTIGVAVVIDANGRMWTTHNFEQLGTAGSVTAAAPKPAATAPAPRAAAPPTTAPRPRVTAPAAATPTTVAVPVAPPMTVAPPPPPPPAPVVEAPARIKISLELLRGAAPSL